MLINSVQTKDFVPKTKDKTENRKQKMSNKQIMLERKKKKTINEEGKNRKFSTLKHSLLNEQSTKHKTRQQQRQNMAQICRSREKEY